MMLKLKLQYFGHLMWRVDSDAGRDWEQEEKGTTEDEMAGWHHWLDGRESQWTPGVGDGQGTLECCDSWGRKESDTTEQLIWSHLIGKICWQWFPPVFNMSKPFDFKDNFIEYRVLDWWSFLPSILYFILFWHGFQWKSIEIVFFFFSLAFYEIFSMSLVLFSVNTIYTYTYVKELPWWLRW